MPPLYRQVPAKITLMLLGAAAILIANGYVSHQNTLALQKANSWLVHTADVLQSTARTNAQLARAGEAQRGFLLTGDETFITHYEDAAAQVKQKLPQLQALTSDSSAQQQRLERLIPLVTERLRELEEAIEIYRRSGPQAAAENVKVHEARALGASIQSILSDFRAEEDRLRGERELMLARSTRITAISGALAIVVGLAQLFLSWYVVALYLGRQRDSEAKLERLNAHLEKTVEARTNDLSRLTRHLMSVREDEKAKIARELHDELGSNLTATSMDLAWMAKHRAADAPLQERLSRSSHLIRSTVEIGRRIIHDLRPPLLDTLGLSAAIEAHVTEFAKHFGVEAEVDVDDELPELVEGCPIALFRIMQEALTNVARYAQAGHIKVSLRCVGNDLILEIADDGVGIPENTEAKPMFHGVLGMRERAAAFSGKLHVARRTDAKGTVVRVTLPCAQRKAA